MCSCGATLGIRCGERKEIRIKADELLAQALEHEIDHLNGVLYADHLENVDKLRKIEPEETGLQSH